MKLKNKLILLSAVPLTGLVVTMACFCLRTRSLEAAVHQSTTESAVQADLARTLQLNVVQVQQYFSDVSATRALDGLDDGFKLATEQHDAFLAGLKTFKIMFEREHDDADTKQVAAIEQAFTEYYEAGHNMATAYVKDGPAAGNKLMAGFDKTAEHLTGELETFVKQQTEEFTGSLKAVESSSHKTAMVVLFGGLALTIGTLALAFFSIRSIIGPLQIISSQVTDNAAHVNLSANQLSNASQTVAEGASQQAASLEETSASLEEISSMTKRNSENATNAAALGRQSRDSASAGLERINELSNTLNTIKAAVGEMQSAVNEMQTSSQQVSKIIKTIDEIAFQTNLLALNAAVEAARAGEAGMGFAVVADEVRALAQRSAQAAKDTSEKIEAAVKRSELGGVASAKVVKSLTEVEATAQSIEQVFNGIVVQIKSLDEVIAEIAAASKEQSAGVGEVNMAVSQMDKVTQSNAASAEENAAAANEMNTQARTLQQIVTQLEAIVTGQIAREVAEAGFTSAARAPQYSKPKAKKACKPAARNQPMTVAASSLAPAAGGFDIPMPDMGGESPTGAFKDF
jgi:methyl-accepting chemotaxis protein